MNETILQYLVFEGYDQTAVKFAQQVGLPIPFSIATRRQIKLMILKGDVSGAIDLIDMEYPELLEDNELYFQLLLMNLIEMIRANKGDEKFIMSVIHFTREKLISKAMKNPIFIEQLEMTMTLLLYSANDQLLPNKLKKLYDVNRRRVLSKRVNQSILDKGNQLHELLKYEEYLEGLK